MYLFSPLCSISDLVNVFEVFLPQLLLYPNPSDPLNGEAAALMMRDRTSYEQRVKGSISAQAFIFCLCNFFFIRMLSAKVKVFIRISCFNEANYGHVNLNDLSA